MTDNTINDDMTTGGAAGTLLANRYRVGPPDLLAREKILELNLMNAQASEEIDLHSLAEEMENASGSDMTAVVAAAKQLALGRAIREDSEPIAKAADFDEACRRIPPSITNAILAPYRAFIKDRF